MAIKTALIALVVLAGVAAAAAASYETLEDRYHVDVFKAGYTAQDVSATTSTLEDGRVLVQISGDRSASATSANGAAMAMGVFSDQAILPAEADALAFAVATDNEGLFRVVVGKKTTTDEELLAVRSSNVARLEAQKAAAEAAAAAPAEVAAPPAETQTTVPFHTTQEGDAYVMTGSMPGFAPEDINLAVEGHSVTIKASRVQETVTATGTSRSRGNFQQTVVLPEDADMSSLGAGYDADGNMKLSFRRTTAVAAPEPVAQVEAPATTQQAVPAPAATEQAAATEEPAATEDALTQEQIAELMPEAGQARILNRADDAVVFTRLPEGENPANLRVMIDDATQSLVVFRVAETLATYPLEKEWDLGIHSLVMDNTGVVVQLLEPGSEASKAAAARRTAAKAAEQA